MFGEHHDLAQEFPDLKARIHDLKTKDQHFAELYAEYQAVDKEIYRIEEQIETPSDAYTEELKKKRVALKDQLYKLLTSSAS
jgi:uncharacterized protein YdcH (DUF465 family)